jgi:hypothetical protein
MNNKKKKKHRLRVVVDCHNSLRVVNVGHRWVAVSEKKNDILAILAIFLAILAIFEVF